jgi:hypothetical protein
MTFPDDFVPCLQGVVPGTMVTCALDGTPNVTTISQCFPVGTSQIAISNQFLSKARRNLLENPQACIQLIHPGDGAMWIVNARFDHAETEGPLFDAMEMQLEVIASMSGMEDVFKLEAADVLDVLDIRRIDLGAA